MVCQVAERQRDGVGGINGPQRCSYAQQRLHHTLDLVLAGGAVACDGLFDLVWRVLNDVGTGGDRLGHDDAAGLANGDSGSDVVLEQHSFDGNHSRSVLDQQRPDLGLDHGQALRYAQIRRCCDDARGDSARLLSPSLDAPITAASQPRIDPEHEHTYDNSQK